MTKQSTAKTEPLTLTSPRQSLIWTGAKSGARVALVLSVAYAICSVPVGLALRGGLVWLSYTLVYLFVGAPLIAILGILPALVLGTLTGAVLAEFASGMVGKIPRAIFVLPSICTCIAVVAAIHDLWGIQIAASLNQAAAIAGQPAAQLIIDNDDLLSPFNSYPLYIGIPSLIYILAGGVVGWRLMTRAAKSQANTT